MAIHHPTPPLGGGERPRLPSAQVGPVTQAIRNMRSDVSCQLGDIHGIRALSRTEIEDLIGGLIDLLDAMDGDLDLETTALERAGRGFEWSGLDDSEDSHDAEANTDDNGIVDLEAAAEQGFRGYGSCL